MASRWAERRTPILTSFMPVVYGQLDQACLGVVMRQQLRLGLDGLWKLHLQYLCNALVILLAGAFKQRLIGGLLDEAVLEAVGRLRWYPPLIEQFHLHQLPESVL